MQQITSPEVLLQNIFDIQAEDERLAAQVAEERSAVQRLQDELHEMHHKCKEQDAAVESLTDELSVERKNWLKKYTQYTSLKKVYRDFSRQTVEDQNQHYEKLRQRLPPLGLPLASPSRAATGASVLAELWRRAAQGSCEADGTGSLPSDSDGLHSSDPRHRRVVTAAEAVQRVQRAAEILKRQREPEVYPKNSKKAAVLPERSEPVGDEEREVDAAEGCEAQLHAAGTPSALSSDSQDTVKEKVNEGYPAIEEEAKVPLSGGAALDTSTSLLFQSAPSATPLSTPTRKKAKTISFVPVAELESVRTVSAVNHNRGTSGTKRGCCAVNPAAHETIPPPHGAEADLFCLPSSPAKGITIPFRSAAAPRHISLPLSPVQSRGTHSNAGPTSTFSLHHATAVGSASVGPAARLGRRERRTWKLHSRPPPPQALGDP